MKKNAKRIQGKCWTFIIYPGKSAPDDWQDRIRLLQTDFAYSPLHDPDPDCKDPHVHVILQYPHNIGLSTIEEISRVQLGGTQPFLVFNRPKLCQYLTHMNDPWKDKQYMDPMDVTWSGIPYLQDIMQTSGTPECVKEIVCFLRDHPDIHTYRELMLYAMNNDMVFWLEYINSHVYQINSLLKGY